MMSKFPLSVVLILALVVVLLLRGGEEPYSDSPNGPSPTETGQDAPQDAPSISSSEEAAQRAPVAAAEPERLEVRGRAVGPLGNAVAGVTVIVRSASEAGWVDRARGESGPEGRFQLHCESSDSIQIALQDSTWYATPINRHGVDAGVLDVGEVFVRRGVRVYGSVVGPGGEPLAGVEIGLDHHLGLGTQSSDPLTAALNRKTPWGVSGTNGSFSLPALAPQSVRLLFEAENCAPRLVTGSAPVGAVQVALDVAMSGLERISGVMVRSPGAPLETCRLRLSRSATAVAPAGEGFFQTTPFREHYQLQAEAFGFLDVPGAVVGQEATEYVVQAFAASGAAVPLSAPVSAWAGDEDVQVRLLETATIRVRVQDEETGDPIAGARVTHRARWGKASSSSVERVSAPQGEVVLEVPVGLDGLSMIVTADAPGYVAADPVELSLASNPGEVDVDLELEALAPLAVQVEDAVRGTPVRSAAVKLSYGLPPTYAFPFVRVLEATTDEEGRVAFEVPHVDEVQLTVGAAGYGTLGPRSFRTLDRREALRVKLESAGSLTITTVGEDGRIVPGQALWLRRATRTGDVWTVPEERATDDAGRLVIDDLAPGKHSVVAASLPVAPQENLWRSVEVLPGENVEVQLDVPAVATTEIQLRLNQQPVFGAQVSIWPAVNDGEDWTLNGSFLRSNGMAAQTSSAGTVRFDRLPADDYMIVASGGGLPTVMAWRRALGPGVPSVSIEATMVPTAGTLLGPDGEPAFGGLVGVVSERGLGELLAAAMQSSGTAPLVDLPQIWLPVATDGAGRFALEVLEGDGIFVVATTGHSELVVMDADGLAGAEWTLQLEKTAEVSVALDGPQEIVGQVTIEVAMEVFDVMLEQNLRLELPGGLDQVFLPAGTAELAVLEFVVAEIREGRPELLDPWVYRLSEVPAELRLPAGGVYLLDLWLE